MAAKGRLIPDMAIAELVLVDECQMRVNTSADHIEQLADAVREGVKLPPVKARRVDRIGYVVVDGWQRIEAHKLAKRANIACLILGNNQTATMAHAVADAAGANREHLGLPRTIADKRKAVRMMVKHFPSFTSRAIADSVGVSHPFVLKIKNEDKPKPDPAKCRQMGMAETLAETLAEMGAVTLPSDDDGLTEELMDAAQILLDPEETEEQRPKNGSEKFDWRGCDAALARVVRGADEIASTYGQHRCVEHTRLIRVLGEAQKAFMDWRTRIEGM